MSGTPFLTASKNGRSNFWSNFSRVRNVLVAFPRSPYGSSTPLTGYVQVTPDESQKRVLDPLGSNRFYDGPDQGSAGLPTRPPPAEAGRPGTEFPPKWDTAPQTDVPRMKKLRERRFVAARQHGSNNGADHRACCQCRNSTQDRVQNAAHALIQNYEQGSTEDLRLRPPMRGRRGVSSCQAYQKPNR